jgi:hypothetical protein
MRSGGHVNGLSLLSDTIALAMPSRSTRIRRDAYLRAAGPDREEEPIEWAAERGEYHFKEECNDEGPMRRIRPRQQPRAFGTLTVADLCHAEAAEVTKSKSGNGSQ